MQERAISDLLEYLNSAEMPKQRCISKSIRGLLQGKDVFVFVAHNVGIFCWSKFIHEFPDLLARFECNWFAFGARGAEFGKRQAFQKCNWHV